MLGAIFVSISPFCFDSCVRSVSASQEVQLVQQHYHHARTKSNHVVVAYKKTLSMELRYKLQQQQSRWLGWVLLAVALAVWLPCAAAGKRVL